MKTNNINHTYHKTICHTPISCNIKWQMTPSKMLRVRVFVRAHIYLNINYLKKNKKNLQDLKILVYLWA